MNVGCLGIALATPPRQVGAKSRERSKKSAQTLDKDYTFLKAEKDALLLGFLP